jgi:hypothetical protein
MFWRPLSALVKQACDTPKIQEYISFSFGRILENCKLATLH